MVEVVESCMVVPLEKTPQHDLWISNIDILYEQLGYTPLIYCYPASSSSDDPNFFSVDAVKNALAKVLVPFYPIAGRLVMGADNRLKIECNAAGALLVVAESELTLDSFTKMQLSPEMTEMFFPSQIASAHQYPSVLFMLQMTFFKCGGMALSVARHHVLHDMRSANHFLQTWVNMTRGCTGADLPPPPFLDRTVLRARSPPVVQFDHPECIPKIINPSQTPGATTSISCAMKLSQDQINILKCSGEPDSTVDLSTFSVVAAHVWKCVCAAGGHGFSPENNARLVLPVDVRNHVDPPLPQQYLGNAIIQTAVDARVHDVLLESVAGLAQKIKGALDRVDDSYVRSAIDCMELMHGSRKSFLTDDDKLASEFKLVNWLGMPTQGADFGWGPPKFMIRSHTASDNVALLKDDGAGISLQISLQRETMLKFKDLFYDIPCLDA